MRERDWQAMVTAAAQHLGYLAYHTHDARRSQPGYPDLCLVRGERLVFLELKTEKGRVRPEQEIWLEMLAEVPGVGARVVRPADLDEIIEEVLR